MTDRIESHREIGIETPLGENVLLLQRVTVTEAISDLFKLELDLVSEQYDLAFEDIVGQNVTVRLLVAPDKYRYFNGFVSRFEQTDGIGRVSRYAATVVPWLWFLTRTTDCRIFQRRTVPEIITEVFRDHGFSDFETRLGHSTFRTWEYCVQYRESDFAFVSRLMEQEGIYYFFEHVDGAHTLVLADGPMDHEFAEDCEQIPYRAPEQEAFADEAISDWRVRQVIQPGQVSMRDYDFMAPRKSLEVRTAVSRQHAHADYEVFDYPGEYWQFPEGESYARVRLEEIQAQHEVITATTTVRRLFAGCRFGLIDHPRVDTEKEYIVVANVITASTDSYDATPGAGGEFEFSSSFEAIPALVRYRAPRRTPIPRIKGPQTAVVVGPEGERIYPDKYGRVKIQFHWDRYGKKDQDSSCWVRVSQNWAGSDYGVSFIPHAGQEVIVEFLEGDPDRPIITGRVYNADNMPPGDLPQDKHKSWVGRDHYSNEIVLDATPGKEHIRIYSPHHESLLELGKSLKYTTSSDEGSYVLGDSKSTTYGDTNSVQYGHKHFEHYGTKVSVNAAATFDFTIGASLGIAVGAKASVFLGGSFGLDVGYKFSIVKGWEMSIGSKSFNKSVDKDILLDSDGDFNIRGGKSNNAVVTANSNELTLDWGVDSLSQLPDGAWITALAAASAAIAAACGTAAATTTATADHASNIAEEWDPTTKPADPNDPTGPTVQEAANTALDEATRDKNAKDEDLARKRRAKEAWDDYQTKKQKADDDVTQDTNGNDVRNTNSDDARDAAQKVSQNANEAAGLGSDVDPTSAYESARDAAEAADVAMDQAQAEVAAVQNQIDNQADHKEGGKIHEEYKTTATGYWIGTGIAGGIGLIAALVGAHKKRKAKADAENQSPRVTKSKVSLDDGGILLDAEKKASLTLFADGKIELNGGPGKDIEMISGDGFLISAKSDVIVLEAADVVADQGTFTTKNIKDLG